MTSIGAKRRSVQRSQKSPERGIGMPVLEERPQRAGGNRVRTRDGGICLRLPAGHNGCDERSDYRGTEIRRGLPPSHSGVWCISQYRENFYVHNPIERYALNPRPLRRRT